MRTKTFISLILCIGLLFSACKKDGDSEDNANSKGFIEFKTSNPMAIAYSPSHLKSIFANPALTGDTTTTYTTNLLLCIGDVWVSQGEVKAGETDNLEWIKLTSVTNTSLKLFENYSFNSMEIPAGNYKSVKITFKSVFYRYVQLASNLSVSYQLLETMSDWTTPCSEAGYSWITNYFGPGGNHSLNSNNQFKLEASGETIGGFKIEANKTAVVSWRLFGGATSPCITYLFDNNKNLEWDCGTDSMDFDCSGIVNMWDFLVEYI